MAQYEIRFDPVRESGGQLNSIRSMLEEYSDTLHQMSLEMRGEMNHDASILEKWSGIIKERADEVRRANVCLETVVDSFNDAERLTYELMTGTDYSVEESSYSGGGSSKDGGKTDSSGGKGTGGTSGGSRVGEGNIMKPGHPHHPSHGNDTSNQSPDGPFQPWGNDPTQWPDWEHWQKGVSWTFALPLLFTTIGPGRHTLREIWKLIRSYFGGIGGRNDSSADSSSDSGGGGGGESGSGISSDIVCGSGETALSEEEFADAEAEVDALMESGCYADDMQDDSLLDEESIEMQDDSLLDEASMEMQDDSLLDEASTEMQDDSLLDEASIEMQDDSLLDEASDELLDDSLTEESGDLISDTPSGSSGGSSGHSSGHSSGGSSGGSIADISGLDDEGLSGIETQPVGMGSGEEEPIKPSVDEVFEKEPIVADTVKPSGKKDSATLPSLAEYQAAINAKAGKKNGGVAAPLIGAGSIASVAASGLGLSGIMGSTKAGNLSGMEKPVSPLIATKQSGGIFSGNLKSEYVILASVLSLVFAGASVAAGIHAKNKESKPDDRFRIGYGTSAVLSDDTLPTLPERS